MGVSRINVVVSQCYDPECDCIHGFIMDAKGELLGIAASMSAEVASSEPHILKLFTELVTEIATAAVKKAGAEVMFTKVIKDTLTQPTERN
jgi:hypothetical protein